MWIQNLHWLKSHPVFQIHGFHISAGFILLDSANHKLCIKFVIFSGLKCGCRTHRYNEPTVYVLKEKFEYNLTHTKLCCSRMNFIAVMKFKQHYYNFGIVTVIKQEFLGIKKKLIAEFKNILQYNNWNIPKWSKKKRTNILPLNMW